MKRIADDLGEKYSLVQIDDKYRDLFNGYDIEVANYPLRGKSIDLTVYI